MPGAVPTSVAGADSGLTYQAPGDGAKSTRKSAKGRKQMRWDPEKDQLVLLCVEYIVAKDLQDPEFWNRVASLVNDHLTGEAIKQHLFKLRNARTAVGQDVPPKFDRSQVKARTSSLLAPSKKKSNTVPRKRVKKEAIISDEDSGSEFPNTASNSLIFQKPKLSGSMSKPVQSYETIEVANPATEKTKKRKVLNEELRPQDTIERTDSASSKLEEYEDIDVKMPNITSKQNSQTYQNVDKDIGGITPTPKSKKFHKKMANEDGSPIQGKALRQREAFWSNFETVDADSTAEKPTATMKARAKSGRTLRALKVPDYAEGVNAARSVSYEDDGGAPLRQGSKDGSADASFAENEPSEEAGQHHQQGANFTARGSGVNFTNVLMNFDLDAQSQGDLPFAPPGLGGMGTASGGFMPAPANEVLDTSSPSYGLPAYGSLGYAEPACGAPDFVPTSHGHPGGPGYPGYSQDVANNYTLSGAACQTVNNSGAPSFGTSGHGYPGGSGYIGYSQGGANNYALSGATNLNFNNSEPVSSHIPRTPASYSGHGLDSSFGDDPSEFFSGGSRSNFGDELIGPSTGGLRNKFSGGPSPDFGGSLSNILGRSASSALSGGSSGTFSGCSSNNIAGNTSSTLGGGSSNNFTDDKTNTSSGSLIKHFAGDMSSTFGSGDGAGGTRNFLQSPITPSFSTPNNQASNMAAPFESFRGNDGTPGLMRGMETTCGDNGNRYTISGEDGEEALQPAALEDPFLLDDKFLESVIRWDGGEEAWLDDTLGSSLRSG